MARTPWARARSAAAVMASASATVLASGFSHSTCLPASRAAMAISAWVSPGVQMSMTSMSSRATTSRQSVALSAQPRRAAASAARAASRPTTTAISGWTGRAKKWGAVRQACEWALPMNACPIIATRRGKLCSVMRTPGWRCPPPGPDGVGPGAGRCGSGREGVVDEVVDVVLGHDRRVQLDGARDLDLDQVGHRLALDEQPGQLDAVGGLGRRVDDRRLEHRVVGLDGLHGVLGAGAADHDELVAVGVLDGREDADALVVVVVPEVVDLRGGLQEVRCGLL